MADALHRLALTCLLPGFEGTTAPDWVRRRVGEGLGGVLLFARNVVGRSQLASLSAALRAERPTVLVAMDEEGGDVTRLEAASGSSYPGNLALGVAADPALTRAVGAAIGADLAAAGVNLDTAPVADVNADPRNPVVGVRSFGSDPALVATHTAAMVDGLQAQGVAACAKHFPGHGATAVDSHEAVPTVADDAGSLAAALLPFRAAVAAGARCVMTAHIIVPAWDAVPATLSRRILTGLLREELGFDGLAITDGLEMAAVSGTVGLAEGAVRAVAAGADLLCVGGGLAGEDTVDLLAGALAGAVRAGRLPSERLAQAAGRVAELAAWTAAAKPAGRADRGAGLAAARLALRADGRATTGPGALVVEFRPDPTIVAGDVPWGLGTALAAHDPTVTVLPYPCPSGATADCPAGRESAAARAARSGSAGLIPLPEPRTPADPSPDGTATAAALAGRAAGRPLVLVVRDLHRHGRQRDLLGRLLGARPDAVVVEMGVPVLAPDGAAGYVRTHGAGRVNAEAAAELLLGREAAAATPATTAPGGAAAAGHGLPPEGRRTAR
jgi:beta-N-acetylhexosaminidase